MDETETEQLWWWQTKCCAIKVDNEGVPSMVLLYGATHVLSPLRIEREPLLTARCRRPAAGKTIWKKACQTPGEQHVLTFTSSSKS